MMGQCHTFLGEVALHQKRFSLAREHLEAGLRLVQRVGVIRLMVTTQRFLGDLALAEGKYGEAARIYDALLERYTFGHLDDKPSLARTLLSKALLLMRTKRLPEAVQLLEGSVALYKEAGNVRRSVGTSLVLVRAYAQRGSWWRACRLFLSTLTMAFVAGLLRPRRLLVFLSMHSM